MASPRPIIRQIVFFLLAVMLPSAVLLSFGVVLLRQETELNERRLDELRTFAARDVGDSLFQALEAAYRAPTEAGQRWTDTDPPLLVLGTMQDGALALSRDAMTSAAPAADFQEFLRGAQQEARQGAGISAAIRRLESRLASDEDPGHQAWLTWQISMLMGQAGLPAVNEWDTRLLSLPTDVTDEFGMPWAYFGAERLMQRGHAIDSVRSRVMEDLERPSWISPAALRYLDDPLMTLLPDTASTKAFDRLEHEHAIADWVERRPLILALNPAVGVSWLPVPGTDWLLRRVDLTGERRVAAVRLGDIQPVAGGAVDAIAIAPMDPERDRVLPASLEGLAAIIDANALPLSRNPQRFLIAGIILVLGLTLFGGYLLWRDVRRETRLAQLRTQFVSSVSHELRTPLTSIRLFAETLLEHGGDNAAERERSLSIIANESERLTRMLNNVLNTSRIEQGTMSYRPGPGHLDEVTDRAADAMEYAFKQAGVTLERDIASVEASFDPDAVEQAVINLLSNALKYGASGGMVRLSCHRNGTHAHLSVSDDGPGIAVEEQERIFERFYRAERADDRRITGAGLGLALVQHIAVGHGGTVSLDSTPGSGATFTLSLPLMTPEP